MKNYYFTYSTEGQPFVGGWTRVIACDIHDAVDSFRKVHPDKIEGLLNCAGYYTAIQFYKTSMWLKGNFGSYEQEVIVKYPELSVEDKWDYLTDITSEEALTLLTTVCGYSHDTLDKALYALTGFKSFEDLMVDGVTSSGDVIVVKE